jgi:microcystin-dependent protein
MSECYIGEIRMISFNVAPKGWAHALTHAELPQHDI